MATQDPFAAMGGGVQLPDGGWVPKNHPLAQQYLAQPPSSGAQAGSSSPVSGQTGFDGIQDHAAASATYSGTPQAAPTANTANQGAQNTVLNSYLQRATQPVTVDPNNPVIRQQADAFSAQQERARRQYESEQAERLSAQGLGNSGAMQAERRLAAERAGQATGSFEAMLVQRELERQYAEKAEALDALRGIISADQAAALQRELAALEAALKRESIGATTGLGERELSLKDKLGSGALSLDYARFDWETSPLNPRNWS